MIDFGLAWYDLLPFHFEWHNNRVVNSKSVFYAVEASF